MAAGIPDPHEAPDRPRRGARCAFGRSVVRYRNGRRISQRRYNYIWGRVAKQLPWAATQGITAHWIRHTTLTWVERNYGYAIARAYAGHAQQRGGGELGIGTTAIYVKATLGEVAAALGALTGEPHPLADMTGDEEATQAT